MGLASEPQHLRTLDVMLRGHPRCLSKSVLSTLLRGTFQVWPQGLLIEATRTLGAGDGVEWNPA